MNELFEYIKYRLKMKETYQSKHVSLVGTVLKEGAWMLASCFLLLSSCSSEVLQGDDSGSNPSDPSGSTEDRREVLLTLKNKLTVKNGSSRAIAMAEENAISTLDVYVFGSETEGGTYTFQERFSYRDDASGPIPSNSEELILASGADGSSTTGLLSLKRGLFVKLYCVANDTVLIDPATGNALSSNDLKPIVFNKVREDGTGSGSDAGSNPGSTSGSVIATAGYPSESTFLSFHTSLLTDASVNPAIPASDSEIIQTPLVMSGALTTPLDLTDNTSASRLQAGFRLTRLAARFDIINDAEKSKFTIQSISMGNGRRGASFFPISAYGSDPANADELITYSYRLFSGVGAENPDANQGLSTGAFYSYPSLVEDGGYLILKGTYQINKTESKEVSYQVPFRQQNADDTGTYLAINHNHRYTVAITDADEYHLDFTLRVSDWADDGNVDDYEPENKPGEITVTIPPTFADKITDTYDADRNIHTLSMSLKEAVNFTVNVNATSPLQISKSYGVSGNKYDWLQIETPSSRTSDSSSDIEYKFSVAKGYNLNLYPRCTVRLFDTISGSETILYVEGQWESRMEQVVSVPVDNKLDADGKLLTFYTLSDAPSTITVKISSYGGSVFSSSDESVLKVENRDAPVIVSNVNARSISSVTRTEREAYCTLTAVGVGTATLTLSNLLDETQKETYRVNVFSSEISVTKDNSPVVDDIEIIAATSGSMNLLVTSPGVTVSVDWGNSGGQWFEITPSDVVAGTQNIVITQKSGNGSTMMKPATIKLTNKLTVGSDKEIIIKPILAAPTLSETGYSDNDYNLSKGKTFTFTATAPGGVGAVSSSNPSVATVSLNGSTVIVTPKTMGKCDIIVSNASETTKQSVYKLDISGRTYNGAFVWKTPYGGFYIAATDASGGTTWSAGLTSNNCSDKRGATWVVPTDSEWRTMLGGTTGAGTTSAPVFNFYKNNNIFAVNASYWSSSEQDNSRAYYVWSGSSFMSVDIQNGGKSKSYKVRCVSRP